jgi:hypothetical protein
VRVPEIVLEKILHNLSYQEVYRLSTLCRCFRLDAATVIRIAFRKLVPRIEKEIKEIEETVKPRNNSSARAITDEEFKYLALSDRLLRILISDARVLKATCWRYVRDDRAKEFCLPCGVVLDTFSRYVAAVRKGEMIKHLNIENIFLPEVEELLYLFDNNIEPSLITYYTVEETPYGLKVADILDCCEDANYSINVTHSSGKGPFCVSALYQHRYANTFMEPHFLSNGMTSAVKLHKIYS